MSLRLAVLLAPFCVAACALQPLDIADNKATSSLPQVTYVSSDLGHVAVFTKTGGRFGDYLALSEAAWPSSPARYFEPTHGIQCVSLGPPLSSVEFAIKRPIKQGDEYRCLRSQFHVVKCFAECRAAVVAIKSPLGNSIPGFLNSQIYVDNCLGIVAFNMGEDLTKGMPLDAQWLRGEVGILANTDYPKCRPF